MSGYIRHRVAQTAGHSWDGGLQAYNNPIPRLWLWLLVAAGLLALLYWLLFPSWPVPGGHYQGLLEVEIKHGDERTVVAWSSAAELEAAGGVLEAHRQRLAAEVLRSDYYGLLADARMRADVLAMARASYMDQCSACHGADGRGVESLGADLVDGPWRADAGFREIEQQVEDFNRRRHAGDVDSGVEAVAKAGDAAPHSRGLRPLQIKALTVYVQQLAVR